MKRTFTVILALLLLLVGCMSAMAEPVTTGLDPANIDTTKTGNLYITKYEYNGEGTTGTGLAGQTIPQDATPLEGVEFTYYFLGDLSNYFTPAGTALPTPAKAQEMVNAGTVTVKGTETTDAQGVANFTNLSLGVYYVVETKAPNKVTSVSEPFVVTLPWTNAAGTEWDYEVYVYPKNKTTYGDVTLIKVDEDDNTIKLAGATFKLEKYDNDTSTWIAVGGPSTVTTGTDGTATITGLDAQTNYRLIEVTAPTGYLPDATKAYYFKLNENAEIVAGDVTGDLSPAAGTATISPKTDATGNSITITNKKEDLDKTFDDDSKETTGKVGDTVTYKITTTVPPSITALDSMYVKDTLSDGLTYVENSVSINGMTENTHYTVTATNQIIKIDFLPGQMADFAGQQITITLQATINENAVVGSTGNPNAVELNYDHSTEQGNQPGTVPPPEDLPKVYVAQVIINKVDENGGALEGAEFKLEKKDENGAWVEIEKISTGSKFTFKQLGAGEYRIIETKAPVGYNLLKEPISFNLTFDETTKTFTNSNSSFTGNDGTFSITVKNSTGFDLPKTGGLGTILYTIGGVVLIAAAAFLVFTGGKKKNQKVR